VADEWAAEGIASLVSNTAEVVADGSAVDGRTQITGADVHAIKDRVVELIGLLEANGNEKLNQIVKVAVNALP
jgi:hypothetical protein